MNIKYLLCRLYIFNDCIKLYNDMAEKGAVLKQALAELNEVQLNNSQYECWVGCSRPTLISGHWTNLY